MEDENHMSIFISMPLGGGVIFSSFIFISTYFNRNNASCFLSSSSFTECVIGNWGFTSSNLPYGFLFFFLGFPQNSMHDDIRIIYSGDNRK